ncbi:hypothetical protein DY000_02032514 [Brassica cretica]|uniref:Uncharacterized protein n=1 Tax=Brassica cretica TaxID=69181 RepID=A0ABQ7DX10_BRACR|nr:hypothetical protein DY000_02032514 [Brassica cretica]
MVTTRKHVNSSENVYSDEIGRPYGFVGKKIRRKSVEIFDDIPTDYDGQISDGLLKKPFVGKKLSVICQKLFRPTKLVGIFDVRKYRRQSSSDISDACFLSAIFDAYLPSVNSDARIRR